MKTMLRNLVRDPVSRKTCLLRARIRIAYTSMLRATRRPFAELFRALNVSRRLTGRRDEPGILTTTELESQANSSWHDKDEWGLRATGRGLRCDYASATTSSGPLPFTCHMRQTSRCRYWPVRSNGVRCLFWKVWGRGLHVPLLLLEDFAKVVSFRECFREAIYHPSRFVLILDFIT